MKKALITSLLLFVMGFLHAQMAQWVIPPVYDSIYFASGENLIVTDSLQYKIFWNQDGQRLFTTNETIHPFSGGYAVLTSSTNDILGFYDTKGNFTSFLSNGINVANRFPFFTNGYLIVKRSGYYVADAQGNIDSKRYLKAYPYSNGYAVCHDYEIPQKEKGSANYLIDQERKEVTLVYQGKTFDPADVEFISSVNDENIAFVVIKKSIYVFDGRERELSPLVMPSLKDSKRPVQAKVESGLPLTKGDPSPTIYARCGKHDQITIYFDANLVPTDIYYNIEKRHFNQNVTPEYNPTSPLEPFLLDNLTGLTWDGKTVIPAQFDKVFKCFDNNAFVKLGKKQGLLQVNDKLTFEISINNGSDIAFRHQSYETTVRIDMSPLLSPSKIDIAVDPNSGCLIDKISKQTKETGDGNRAEYTCRLTIPNTITEEPSEYEYPIQLKYDNISLLPFHQKVKAWHDKYYDIIINDAEKEFDQENGLITFPYNINAERYSNEDAVHFELIVLPDTLGVEIQKISTTRGVCKVPVSELNEGVNYLFFELTEQGCPSISFPFALTYTKPAPKAKRKTVAKEDFKINKKTKEEVEYEIMFPDL